MELNGSEKTSQKELNPSDEIPLCNKVYVFFFNVLQRKTMNKTIYCILFILEAIQLNSYVFDNKHLDSWKLDPTTVDLLNTIFGSVRIGPLMKYVKFQWYIIIWGIILAYIFFHSILLFMIIKFNKASSKVYIIIAQTTRVYADILTIFLVIPFTELIMLMLNCTSEGKVGLFLDSITCYAGLHFLYIVLSIIFLLVFILLVVFLLLFMFYPFNHKNDAIKEDTSSDIVLFIFKMLAMLQCIFLQDEWFSIGLMIIVSLFNIKISSDSPTYNNYVLQSCVSIRNATFFWAYFVLLLTKFNPKTDFTGMIYLLAWGYPLIIIVSFLNYKKKYFNYSNMISTSITVNDFITKMKSVIKLIDTFLQNNNTKNAKNTKEHKDDILLRGYIMIHIETCVFDECPLEKFMENNGNYSVQKTCLLHHMNNIFLDGIKQYPQSRLIIMFYIAFNFEKKYNLNTVKTYLAKLEKTHNTMLDDYILFSIKQSNNISCKGMSSDDYGYYNNSKSKKNNEGDGENELQTKEQFIRLKYLIEASTKLYGEFWGILSTNMIGNLNLNKLFTVGNKLNVYLREVNKLWEGELKTKRIDLENQSVIQLYAYFLREILCNKKKADEITRKLNEEQHYESKKTEDDNWEVSNLYAILEHQDFIIFSRTNEKGECQIFQCSNSVVNLLGFQKQDFIGKLIEIIIPSIFAGVHHKMLGARVKGFHNKFTSKNTMTETENKKQTFILPKTKVGYLLPINSKFTIYNDDDFSHTYIIKSKFEYKDSKTQYSYYILTNDEFAIDSISSSSLHLGLSLDLLKKYVVNLNILIRDESNVNEIDFEECHKDYVEEPKKVTWVYPNIIYPKNDSQEQKEQNIPELIRQSETKVFYLQIIPMKYTETKIGGYCFKMNEEQSISTAKKALNGLSGDKRHECQINNARKIMFDLLQLSYIRAEVVNMKDSDEDYFQFNTPYPNPQSPKIKSNRNDYKETTKDKESKGKRKKKHKNNNDSSDDDDDDHDNYSQGNEDGNIKHVEINLKEKLVEYQGKCASEVKQFIFTLPFFGYDISIEKHRSNKERYPSGKITEPQIRISIDEFLKKMELKAVQFYQSRNNDNTKRDSVESARTVSTNLSLNPQDQEYLQGKISTDSSAYLSSIFNAKSVTYIRIFSLCVVLLVIMIISLEFSLSLNLISESQDRIDYVNKAYEMLSAMMYTKFLITEAVKANKPGYPHADGQEIKDYVQVLMADMSNYRKIIFENYASFQNATVEFSNEFYTFTTNTTAKIRTLVNTEETFEIHSFPAMMSRIPSNIFYVSTVNETYMTLTMENRNAYELMMNLLNDYFILWAQATLLLVEDTKHKTSPHIDSLFIYGFSFLLSVLSLIGLWYLVSIFIKAREHPIKLLLTIRKQKFIDLKESSETFLNRLLNKFFGNEETEEESMVEYSSQLKNEDITIDNFTQKKKSEFKQSIQSSSEYLFNYLKTVAFFLIFQGYMSFKYFYVIENMHNINLYTDVLNATHSGESDIILEMNVYKSYFFNKTIPILNTSDTEAIYLNRFVIMTQGFEDFLFRSLNTSNFLENAYLGDLFKKLNEDITSIVPDRPSVYGRPSLLMGFKPIATQCFEYLRFLLVHYLSLHNADFITGNSVTGQINYIVRFIMKPWFKAVLESLDGAFQAYYDYIKLIHITIFIVLLVGIILLYCLVWKNYEVRLTGLLKMSVDLINLIPEEIKENIVLKLNKEDQKKDS